MLTKQVTSDKMYAAVRFLTGHSDNGLTLAEQCALRYRSTAVLRALQRNVLALTEGEARAMLRELGWTEKVLW